MTTHLKQAISLAYKLFGLALILSSLVYGVVNITSHFDKEFQSPFDELQHFDYWQTIYRDHKIPEVYGKIKPENIKSYCLIGKSGSAKGDCDNPKPNIENTATNYAPTFYLATAIISAPLDAIIPTDNDFHLAKLSGMAWGFISLILLWVLACEMRIPQPIIALIIFATGQNPQFVFGSITFNQEIFVLAACTATLILYLKKLKSIQSSFRFAFWAGIASAFCLSIKPTALLIIIIIGTSELLSSALNTKKKAIRLTMYGLSTGMIYVLSTMISNRIRGTNQSDGLMRDYIILHTPSVDFSQWINIIWSSFERSTASYGWRALVDYDIPWLFPHFHIFFIASLLLAVPAFIISKLKNVPWPASMNIFIGNMLAFAALPIALSVYCQIIDFPFFFQPRYYTVYTCLAAVTATAFLVDLLSPVSSFRKSFYFASDREKPYNERKLSAQIL
ncbi:hypothetical protein [Hydrogenophaga sp. PAMC20947]|uniref:hypothetical protein n=1 Tax=Hydrogenophaga sp. PAMC20947 TaxID=2565558 RepID=UPI00109DB734|nr:hypothetical protein [Hydrogenophaga sp. PAMC20947]QCB45751.1 hypothetical protein E5678_06780 [Hydrogenophaga sp. PAMC20947]